MHSLPLVQARQVPLAQMGLVAGQSGWPRHWMQLPAPPQNAAAPEVRVAHSALPLHARQRPVVVLQKGVLPAQWLFWVHSTHAPAVEPAVAQWASMKVVRHSGSPVQARQIPWAVLQKGVPPEQCEFWVHDWQRWVVVLHLGLVPMQWRSLVHWTHAPWKQPGVLVLLVAQAASLAQATQAPSALQIGLAGSWVQSAEVAHSTQAPVRVPLRAQRRVGALHSPSAPQARQRPAARSHTGVVPEQWVLAVHCTQLLVARRQ
jgi:hypothetical protein